MSETDEAAGAPATETRQWRASQDTFAKAAEKHSKDLPDDEKVKVVKGDVLSARVIKRHPYTIIISNGVLNGAPLPDNIRVIQRHHWQRILPAAGTPTPAEAALPVESDPPAPPPPAPRRVRAKFIRKSKLTKKAE